MPSPVVYEVIFCEFTVSKYIKDGGLSKWRKNLHFDMQSEKIHI